MRERLGVNAHLPGPPALDLAQALGVGSVRCDFNWDMIQPKPDVWDWTLVDQVVYGARDRHLEVLACLAYTPPWLNAGLGRNTPPSIYDWESFVWQVAQHYGPNVWHFEIWNEPNAPAYYSGSVERYVDEVLWPASNVLHRIRPENRVIGPALMTEHDWPSWLDVCLKRGGQALDIISVHNYGNSGIETYESVTKLSPPRPSWLPSWVPWWTPGILQAIETSGIADKPIWLNETGWNTLDVSETQQAQYLQELLERFETDTRVERLFLYQLIDEESPVLWGLYRQDGTPKPAVAVMQRYAGIGTV